MEAYQRLEKEWAKWNDLDPQGMVACSSGTAALHLALEALQLPQGSEVITSDYNMIAVPRAIAMAGLVPVFVDCDGRLLMDAKLASKHATYNPYCVVIATHIYGRVCDMETVSKFATFRIEDLAEAHGVRPHPVTDAACWSFYRNKIIAGEEGGSVWFRNPKHAALARQLRSLGFTAAHDFNHIPRGHNYRMSNAHAQLILIDPSMPSNNSKVTRNKQRREIESWYDAACPSQFRMPPRQAPWVYDLRIPGMPEAKQNELIRKLRAAGIAARHGFKPMCDQQEFIKCRMIADDNINGTKSRLASKEVLYLPIQPGITTEEVVNRAMNIIKSV